MTVPAGVHGRLLVGVDGPEVRTSGAVAVLVAPMARTWFDAARARGMDRDALDELGGWVAALEVAASVCSERLACPASVTNGGQFRAGDQIGATVIGEQGYSAKATADRLGISSRSVGRLLGRGDLNGRKVGTAWLVDVASIEAYEHRRT